MLSLTDPRPFRLAGVAMLSAIMAWALSSTTPVRALERFLYDMRVSSHVTPQPVHSDIAIIAIDDQSLSRFPFTSPINRNFLASVLADLDKKGAAVIGLDVVLDRPTTESGDAALETVMSEASASLVLVSDLDGAQRDTVCQRDAASVWGDQGGQTLDTRTVASVLQRFSQYTTLGHGLLCIDTLDEVVRLKAAAVGDMPTFANAIVAAGGAGMVESRAREAIPFLPGPDGKVPFSVYSAEFVSALPEEWIAGKTVLVGAIQPYSRDWHTTPLRFAGLRQTIEPVNLMPEGKLPGIVIHAYAVAAGLDGRSGPPLAPRWGALCLVLGVLAGVGLGVSRLRLWAAAVAVGGLLVCYWAAIFWLYGAAGVMAPYTGFASGLLLAIGMCFALLEQEERAQRRQIHASFRHFLAPQVVDRLARSPSLLRRNAEDREITALFTDLAGFTAFVDSRPGVEVATILNGYLDIIIDTVVDHGGVVDKIVGDAVHALFSAPEPDPGHRLGSVRCAIAIVSRTEAYRKKLADGGVTLGLTRVGVNCGRALVGNFGGSRRFDYTAHGSVINIAARLEAENKRFGTQICVSEASRVDAPGVLYREIGTLPIRGLKAPIRLFEVSIFSAEAEAAAVSYNRAFALLATDKAAAKREFEALSLAFPGDGLVKFQQEQLENNQSGILAQGQPEDDL